MATPPSVPAKQPRPDKLKRTGSHSSRGSNPGITPKQWEVFFKELEASSNSTRSCLAAGFDRSAIYVRSAKDPEFKVRYEEARQRGLDSWEDEVARRAFNGHYKPVWYNGQIVGEEQVFSDTLAMFLLRGGKPEKYKDRAEVTSTNVSVELPYTRLTEDEIDAELRRRLGL